MNMKNLFLLLVCGLCFQSVGSFAQGYKIQVNIPQMSNKQVILANYFEGKVYAVDTAQINSNGTGYFQKNGKSLEYPPNCSRLTQQDLIIRELEEKCRSWADS